MKRRLLVLMACFPVIGLMAAEVEPLAGATIITLERKRDVYKRQLYRKEKDAFWKKLGISAVNRIIM